MVKSIRLIAAFLIVGSTALAQQGSDIYLFNFKIDQHQFSLSNGRNITNTPGYDNQPYFMPDGESLLFTSDDGFGQTDIYRYNIKARSERRLTFTPNSEYSPTPTPDGKYISCIILENNNKNQFLWKYPINGAIPQRISSLNPVGYHCWINNDKLGVFVVGEPNTLQLLDVAADQAQKVADNPGVTLLMSPKDGKVLNYVDLSDPHEPRLMSLNTETGETSVLISLKKKTQYYTWTPNGILLAGDGKRLYKFDPAVDKDWVEMANLNDYGIKEFTRLAVSPKGDYLAVVASE